MRASLRRWEAELLHGIVHFHLEQSALQLALDALPARERAAKVRLVAHPALWMLGTAANLGWAAGLLRDGAGACGEATGLPFAVHFAGCGLGEPRARAARGGARAAVRAARLPAAPAGGHRDAPTHDGGARCDAVFVCARAWRWGGGLGRRPVSGRGLAMNSE